MRLIDAVPEAEDLAVSVDGQRGWRHAAFRSNTGFQGIGEGTYQINIAGLVGGVRREGRNYLLCQKGKAYTVVAISPEPSSSEAPALRIFNEDKSNPVPPGKARLRLINADAGTGPVDVLFNNIVGFGDTPFGSRTQPLLLDAGVYEFKVNAASDMEPLMAPMSLRFLPGRAYTLVAMGNPGSDRTQGVSLVAYPDNQ